MSSITQVSEEVKQECSVEWCHEEVFRDGLCWDCFFKEVRAEWDAQDAERQACLEGVGYIFSAPKTDKALDFVWWGDPLEEACGDDDYRLPI